jgi:hypothetical protein
MDQELSRRGALKCLGIGAGTLFTLNSGVFDAIDLAEVSALKAGHRSSCRSAIRISDSTRTQIPTSLLRSTVPSIW